MVKQRQRFIVARDGRLVVPIQSKCCSKFLYNFAQILASVTPGVMRTTIFSCSETGWHTVDWQPHMFFQHVFGSSIIHLIFVKEIVITDCMQKGFTKNGKDKQVCTVNVRLPRYAMFGECRASALASIGKGTLAIMEFDQETEFL
jgi:hypothetical protein